MIHGILHALSELVGVLLDGLGLVSVQTLCILLSVSPVVLDQLRQWGHEALQDLCHLWAPLTAEREVELHTADWAAESSAVGVACAR